MGLSMDIVDDEATLLVELKAGATSEAPLFFFSGGDGDPLGLSQLAVRIQSVKRVIGVDFCRGDAQGRLPSTIQEMASRAHAAIRKVQPLGPYYLVGYSFGGLVAFEVARLLKDGGDNTALLGLIDTFFDQRSWTKRIFFRSQARLIYRHLANMRQLPVRQMVRMLSNRSWGLFRRVLRRQAGLSLKPLGSGTLMTREQHCKEAISQFEPKFFAGKIICFDADSHEEYGCSPIELWRSMVEVAECATFTGTHVGLVNSHASLSDLAAAIDGVINKQTTTVL